MKNEMKFSNFAFDNLYSCLKMIIEIIINMLNSNRVDSKYLEELHNRERKLEEKLEERQKEKNRANETYLTHIRK